jgi:1-deoxy-D-xylulose-5-phosphate reductoisomerase
MSCPPRKRVILLGATGSIGSSTLKVARDLPDRIEIVGMAAARSSDELARHAAEFNCRQLCLTDAAAAQHLSSLVPSHTRVFSGHDGLTDLVRSTDADLVLVAIVGTAGLRPALAAIELGRDLAVASKEILVMAGRMVMDAARRKGVHVLPVDSEHNAIFQCVEGRPATDIKRLILTASGGPFRTWPAERIAAATREEALRHPTWDMGRKITIDSATLFNKGLEMIEARWLFDVPMDRVDVVVHPQSIIHSMVEFTDHSILAQLSRTDMCFPIQYALTWPDRVPSSIAPLDFPALARLDFEAPRRSDFPAIDLAVRAGSEGGTLPAIFNAANEVAVAAFLDGRISFPQIWQTVARVMDQAPAGNDDSLESVIAADRAARELAARLTDSPA